MFIELRFYYLKPGQRDRWVKFMEEEIIPFQISKGMVIQGSFIAPDEENLYVWLRRFESEEELKLLNPKVYQSEYWKNQIAPKIPEMLDRETIKVTRLQPTAKSVMR